MFYDDYDDDEKDNFDEYENKEYTEVESDNQIMMGMYDDNNIQDKSILKNNLMKMFGGNRPISSDKKLRFSMKGVKDTIELKNKVMIWFKNLSFHIDNFRQDFSEGIKDIMKNYKFSIILILGFILYFIYAKLRSKDTYKGYGKLKIVVTNYNSENGIIRCLKSIKNQKYKYYDVVVVDDSSTDKLQWKFIKKFCKKNSWKCLKTSRNVGSLYCYVLGINAHRCKLNDVIVMIDGDDWLIRNDAFKIVRNAYRSDSELCLTFGNYLNFVSDLRKYQIPGNSEIINNNWPYIDKIIIDNNYRKEPWIYYPLRTFKYFIWKKLDQKRLLDSKGIGRDGIKGKGKMYRIGTDRILMYPLLEIANGRIKFISEFLYAYNIHIRNIDKFQESEEFAEKKRIIEYLREEKPHESSLSKVFVSNKKKGFFARLIDKKKMKNKMK